MEKALKAVHDPKLHQMQGPRQLQMQLQVQVQMHLQVPKAIQPTHLVKPMRRIIVREHQTPQQVGEQEQIRPRRRRRWLKYL